MSRSNYTDNFDKEWQLWFYRSAVESSIRGKRGQQALKELLAALEAMPNKRLIEGALERDGEYCALGILGKARGLAMDNLDPEEADMIAKAFNIAPSLAREIAFENDEASSYTITDEQRWQRMRDWVASQVHA